MSKHIDAAAKFPRIVNGQPDHKAWAKRILWREEQRDSSLLPIQVKFASEAMQVKHDAD